MLYLYHEEQDLGLSYLKSLQLEELLGGKYFLSTEKKSEAN